MKLSLLNPSFVWETRGSIIQATTLVIPLAIEAIHLAVKIYQDPKGFKEKVIKIVTDLKEFKNIAKLVCAILLIGGVTAAAYYLAPAAFAVAAAVIAFQVSVKIWKGLDQLPQQIRNAIKYLKDSFQQAENEPIEAFRQRRLDAIKKIVKYTLIAIGVVALTCAAAYIGLQMSQAASVWALTDYLPLQTPVVVFLEYAALAVAHTGLAIHSWRKKEHGAALFHLISAVTALAFPISYFFTGDEIRLHHSFIGLALQLAPWRPVKFLGCVITFDSFLNSYLGSQGIVRGNYLTPTRVQQYDYQNALLAHLPFAVTALSLVTLLSRGIDLAIPAKKSVPVPLPETSHL